MGKSRSVDVLAEVGIALAILATSCSGSTEYSPSGAPGAGGQASPIGAGGSAGGGGVTSNGGNASSGQGNASAGGAGEPAEGDRVGDRCFSPGSLGCNGTNQREMLVCVGDPLATWQASGECAENERCDSTEHVGHCAPMLSDCVGHEPFVGMCVGSTYVECGVDLVTRAYEQACTERCVPNASGADCIELGCGDGAESSSETCDDGNNENGDGCSADCTWEPPQGKVDATAKYFGSPAAISGDTIVAIGGSPRPPDAGAAKQALYVFRNNGLVWSLEAKLDAVPGSYYGGKLALEGDTLAVSGEDTQDPEGVGTVFIYRRIGTIWSLQQELVATRDGAPDHGSARSFGDSLSLTEDTLAVGATGDDNQGGFSGAVFVFARTGDTFTPQAKLVAQLPDGTPDGTETAVFGYSVSVSGDSLAVGALLTRGDELYLGAAYIFQRSGATWDVQVRLRATQPLPAFANGGKFGFALALQDDVLVVGSPADREYAGSADVFRRSGSAWAAEAHLVPPPDARGEDSSFAEFGSALALSESGNTIAIGSPRHSVPDWYQGAIHLFSRQGGEWVWQARLQAKPSRGMTWRNSDDEFGRVLGMDRDRVLTGVDNAETTGRAYLFEPRGSVWQERLELRALDVGP